MSGNWIQVCNKDEIDEEDVIRFDHGGRTFAVYRSPDDEFFATDGLCTHAPQELGWLPLSVPWVDFEPTIDALHAKGEISPGERKKLLLAGRFLHFSERTYAKVADECHFRKPRRDHILAAIRGSRVERKRNDARLVLEWLSRDKFLPVNRDWRFAATSHWELLHAEVTRNAVPVTLE